MSSTIHTDTNQSEWEQIAGGQLIIRGLHLRNFVDSGILNIIWNRADKQVGLHLLQKCFRLLFGLISTFKSELVSTDTEDLFSGHSECNQTECWNVDSRSMLLVS